MNLRTIIATGAILLSGTAVGQNCNVGGPYNVDEHTLLLLHFDGSYEGAQGQVPLEIFETSFAPGMFNQGLLANEVDRLHFASTGNIDLAEGTVEFWVKPNWPGTDPAGHIFFEIGDCFWCDRMRVMHDGVTVRFLTWDDTGESGINIWGQNWVEDQWRHIGVTWSGNEIEMYLDAVLQGSLTATHFPQALTSIIEIGSACMWGSPSCDAANTQSADAVIDEFRISSVRRCFEQIAPPVEVFNCNGFEPPMAGGPVKVKRNRALPLKAEIFDTDGFAVTDADVSAPPVVQVWYEFGTSDEGLIEVEALPAGVGDDGNQFVFTTEDRWQFNLKTGSYTAPGTYTVFMESGDTAEYMFETPTCTAEFVVR